MLRPRTVLSKDSHVQDGSALRCASADTVHSRLGTARSSPSPARPLAPGGCLRRGPCGCAAPREPLGRGVAVAGLAAGTAPGTPDSASCWGARTGARSPLAPIRGSASACGSPVPSDGDGVEHAVDLPKDSDSDRILDQEDASIQPQPGVHEMHGCPARDTDQARCSTTLDNCPDAAGPAANPGLPRGGRWCASAVASMPRRRGPLRLRPGHRPVRSLPLLDQVARILRRGAQRDPLGHHRGRTGWQGSADYNRDLSQRRAEAVHDFLAQKGVARDAWRPAWLRRGSPRPTPNAPTPGTRPTAV